MFVAFPQADGAAIGSIYVLKTYFSKSLADGLTDAQLKARFTVRYGADDTWPAGAQTLDAAALSISYNATADYHALAFSLPNFYDGRPGFLYRVEIFQNRPDPLVDLTATRRLAALSGNGPRVNILRPLEVDESGRPVEIILPDQPMDYTVRVETDTTTTAVDLAFVIGSGTLTPVDFDPVTAGIQPEVQGSSAFWDFSWHITTPGSYRLIATGTSPQAVKTETRNATVVGLEEVLEGEAAETPVLATIAGGYRLSFPTLPGRIYQLQISADLVDWADSGAPLNTAGADGPGTFQVDDTSGAGTRFFRVVIQAAP
jgi:hypothetical protein